MKSKRAILQGLILAALTLLITYIIFGLLQQDYYVWGGIQLAACFIYALIGRIIQGRNAKKIRFKIMERNERLRARIDFNHPEMKKYQLVCQTLYWAAIFGIIFNVIGSQWFGLGLLPPDYIPPE